MLNSSLPMRWRLTKVLINKAANAKARLLLAHGAGAGANSEVMQQLACALASCGIEVWRFNFGYMQQALDEGKRRLPAKMLLLAAEFSQHITQCPADLPLFIGGKSMGGRVASLLSGNSAVQAIFAFGYPFHAPNKQKWRTEHFADLAAPLYIAQGERDAFGSKNELSDKHWPKVELYWLADANHDFAPRLKSGFTRLQLINAAAAFCSRRIDEVLLAVK